MDIRAFAKRILSGDKEEDNIGKKYRIGFSTRSNSAYSRLIRWFTRFPASHSFIFYDDKIIIDASKLKVRLRLWKYFRRWNYIVQVFEIKRDRKVLEKALNMMEYYYGSGYDLSNVAGMVIVRIIDFLFHVRIKNPLGDKNEFHCSELVYKYMHGLGFRIKLEDPDIVTPKILFDYCIDNDKIFIPVIELDHKTCYNISKLYYFENDYSKAFKFIRKAIELNPNNRKYQGLYKKLEKKQ